MRLKPGTPHPLYAQSYTTEQLDALATLKAPKVSPAVARAELVNAALAPDGTLIPNAGAKIIAAARERETAAAAAEITAHVNAKQFLFVVNQDMKPVVYFPCGGSGASSRSATPRTKRRRR
jgi:hypothetical protein